MLIWTPEPLHYLLVFHILATALLIQVCYTVVTSVISISSSGIDPVPTMSTAASSISRTSVSTLFFSTAAELSELVVG